MNMLGQMPVPDDAFDYGAPPPDDSGATLPLEPHEEESHVLDHLFVAACDDGTPKYVRDAKNTFENKLREARRAFPKVTSVWQKHYLRLDILEQLVDLLIALNSRLADIQRIEDSKPEIFRRMLADMYMLHAMAAHYSPESRFLRSIHYWIEKEIKKLSADDRGEVLTEAITSVDVEYKQCPRWEDAVRAVEHILATHRRLSPQDPKLPSYAAGTHCLRIIALLRKAKAALAIQTPEAAELAMQSVHAVDVMRDPALEKRGMAEWNIPPAFMTSTQFCITNIRRCAASILKKSTPADDVSSAEASVPKQ